MNIFGTELLNNIFEVSIPGVLISVFGGFVILVFLLLIVWSFVLKGIALWKAARAGSKLWFIALLVINTLGILELLYIFVFSKRSKAKE